MAIQYKVHLTNQQSVDIQAETINVGVNRLWFFDAEDNLQGAFKWENIQGFSVDGSASGQIVVEELLHEKKKADNLEKTHGPIIAAIERVHQQLQTLESAATSAWLRISDAKKEPREVEFAVSKHPDYLRKGSAELAEFQRTLMPKMKRLLDEVESLLESKK